MPLRVITTCSSWRMSGISFRIELIEDRLLHSFVKNRLKTCQLTILSGESFRFLKVFTPLAVIYYS